MATRHDWVWHKATPGTEEYACARCGSMKAEDPEGRLPTIYLDPNGVEIDDFNSEAMCPPPGWVLPLQAGREEGK